MTAAACRQAWAGADRGAADALDAAFPNGVCEMFSLSDPERTAVDSGELVARILTTPGDYAVDELLTGKLTNCYFNGLSLVRQGASDGEVLNTIATLLAAQDAEALIGAVVAPVSVIRSVGNPDKHFCVYDTDAPGAVAHADIVGTFERTMGRNAWDRTERKRRYGLRDELKKHLVFADTPADLLAALRQAGI